jgi:hypothetical protein
MTPRTPHPSETAAALQQEGVDRQRAAEDTGPAPPRALVEVVREWRDSEAEVLALNVDGGGSDPDAFGAACDRYDAAVEALRAYPLPAPEAPETPR